MKAVKYKKMELLLGNRIEKSPDEQKPQEDGPATESQALLKVRGIIKDSEVYCSRIQNNRRHNIVKSRDIGQKYMRKPPPNNQRAELKQLGISICRV